MLAFSKKQVEENEKNFGNPLSLSALIELTQTNPLPTERQHVSPESIGLVREDGSIDKNQTRKPQNRPQFRLTGHVS